MKPTFFKEASHIWKSNSGDIKADKLNFDLEIHKKLLNIFNVGPYYYFVFNVNNQAIEFMSPLVKEVLGYEPDEIDASFLMDKIHPDDMPWFLNFENKVGCFFRELTIDQVPNYKVSYDYRIRKLNGEYIRILQQVLVIDFDTDGIIIRTLGVHTDISNIKPPSAGANSKLSFIGLNGQPSYYDVNVEELFKISKTQVTKREKEILYYLLNGSSSSEIADCLFISKLTVDTHRKNLLLKMEVANTAELVSKSIKLGLI
jgi:DNA-binding CsgD family transcriptional regulator